ncbi:jhy protein homolog isoform X2 [Lepisosteus oculatus]|uniref:jhy protein homolog isoform X2 n=1 Tax=Lepisosteus oculatus TaxID=7918 RepID=UPI00073FE54E|nr:PREDICTED: uncharacterized protein C11orf63 homolog isoform X2 [Lepisosteus oculatus]
MSVGASRRKLPRPGHPSARPEELPEGPSSFEDSVHLSFWDSLDSDTESLARERQYQSELEKRIRENEEVVNPNFAGESGVPGGHDHSGGKEEEEEEECSVVDSLDEAAFRQKVGKAAPDKTQAPDFPLKSNPKPRKAHLEDEYAELRYDPNWRETVKGAQTFGAVGNQLSQEPEEDLFLDSYEISEDCLHKPWQEEDRGQITAKEYAINGKKAPTVSLSGKVAEKLPDTRLKHPATPHHQKHLHHNKALKQGSSLEEAQARKDGPRTRPETNRVLYKQEQAEPPGEGEESLAGGEERYEAMNERYRQEYERFLRHDSARSRDVTDRQQYSNRRKTKRSSHHSNPKQSRPQEDFVEQNKVTLGVRPAHQRSYLQVHSQKIEQGSKRQDPGAAEELSSISSQQSHEDIFDPEQMWQQRTKKLAGYKNKRMSEKQGKHHDASAKASYEPGFQIPSGRQSQKTLLKDHQHMNVNLTSPHRYPGKDRPQVGACFGDQTNPGEMFSSHSPQQYSWSPRAALLPPFPPYNKSLGRPRLHSPAFLQEHGSHWPRKGEAPWYQQDSGDTRLEGARPVPRQLLPPHGQCPAFSPGDWWKEQISQEAKGPAFTPGSQRSKSCAVLPPIGQTTGRDSELAGQAAEEQKNSMHRSSSEGYLAQMEKQRQLRERANYKAYTLKDYRTLKQDVKLGGLGPSNLVSEETAGKMKRQRQYSDLVREQNKKMSQNPPFPTHNAVASGKTDVAPRRKALEYAKNIPKPKPPLQPKTNQKVAKEGYGEHALYLEDVDLSQLARLEMLQKRHEEEKQVVANFRALRVI